MRGIILATSMSKNAAALWIIQKEKIRNALCLATIISSAIYVFVLIPRNNKKYFQQIREMSSLDSRMYLGFLYPRAFYEIERIEDGESKLKKWEIKGEGVREIERGTYIIRWLDKVSFA